MSTVPATFRTDEANRVRRDPAAATTRVTGGNRPVRSSGLADDDDDEPGTIGQLLRFLAGRIGELAESPAAPTDAVRWPQLGPANRLPMLAPALGFDHVDVALLVCAAAPSLDPQFGELYAALDGRLHRGRARVDLALRLSGGTLFSAVDRVRFSPQGALVRSGFVEVLDDELPLPDRTLRVPERVNLQLFTDGFDDPRVPGLDALLLPLLISTAALDGAATQQVARSLAGGAMTLWIREGSGGTGASVAASALAQLGVSALVLDLALLEGGHGLVDVAAVAAREVCMWQAGLVVVGVNPQRDLGAIRFLAQCPRPMLFVSTAAWDPAISSMNPVLVDAPPLRAADRVPMWQEALQAIGFDDEQVGALDDVVADLAALHFGPHQIVQVSEAARSRATAMGEPVGPAMLRTAAFAQSSARLDSVTSHVTPRVTFDDLVLAPEVLDELRGLADRYRVRHIVRDDWGMERSGSRGRGLTCLFTGPSGTGKTLAAEVVANSLGVELFIINLSQVVDKYVGETEKSLERIFVEAEGLNAVLLFDEADALFGKRSDVQGAHDRYANVEVAYLLQRMERFDGVAVLTSNLPGNIDEAFARRLDLVCTFQQPTAPERRRIWAHQLTPNVPKHADVDLDLLADSLEIAGGTIRNICLSAAYVAAVERGQVTMAHLIRAAEREYRKMGRLLKIDVLLRSAGSAPTRSSPNEPDD